MWYFFLLHWLGVSLCSVLCLFCTCWFMCSAIFIIGGTLCAQCKLCNYQWFHHYIKWASTFGHLPHKWSMLPSYACFQFHTVQAQNTHSPWPLVKKRKRGFSILHIWDGGLWGRLWWLFFRNKVSPIKLKFLKEENNSLINFSFVWYVVLYFILKAEDTLAPTTLK